MTRNFERRWRQLEEHLQPSSEPMIIQVVFVGPDGSQTDGPAGSGARYGPGSSQAKAVKTAGCRDAALSAFAPRESYR